MSLFIALPVKGESFLYFRSGRAILVDAGHSASKLVPAIRKTVPDLRRIDVVLATHSDDDHAGGLEELAERWTAQSGAHEIGEYWLPSSWADVAAELLGDPKAAGNRLMREFDEDRENINRLMADGDHRLFSNRDQAAADPVHRHGFRLRPELKGMSISDAVLAKLKARGPASAGNEETEFPESPEDPTWFARWRIGSGRPCR